MKVKGILQKGSEGAILPTTKVTSVLAPLNENPKNQHRHHYHQNR